MEDFDLRPVNHFMELDDINNRDYDDHCRPSNNMFFGMADRFCVSCRKPILLNYCTACGQEVCSRNVNDE